MIIDEQHKFGVAQREKLVRKGRYPHLLVMTATPIPRTLGLTLYGDLDISVMDQLPAGRGRIKTFVRATDKLPKVFEFIRGKLLRGGGKPEGGQCQQAAGDKDGEWLHGEGWKGGRMEEGI